MYFENARTEAENGMVWSVKNANDTLLGNICGTVQLTNVMLSKPSY